MRPQTIDQVREANHAAARAAWAAINRHSPVDGLTERDRRLGRIQRRGEA